MPQLDITTYYTQSFWLIVIFLIRYRIIRTKYLPRLSYIIKYRREYQEERDWTLRVLSNEITTYGTLIMDLRSQMVHMDKIITNFNKTIDKLTNENRKYVKNSNKEMMKDILELKYDLLTEVNLTTLENI